MRALVAVACVALAACAGRSAPSVPTTPLQKDLAACRAEASQRRGVDTNSKQLAFIDDCLHAKGWRAMPGCVQLTLQGTSFCDYAR